MKQVRPKQPAHRPLAIQMGHRLREGLMIVIVALALFLWVSFATWHAGDPGWLSTGLGHAAIYNRGGRAGAFLADIFLLLFGCIAFLFPVLLVIGVWSALRDVSENSENLTKNDKKKLVTSTKKIRFSSELVLRSIGCLLILVSICGMVALSFRGVFHWLPASPGGVIGELTASGLKRIFSVTGSLLFLMAAFLAGVTLLTGLSWLGLIDAIGFYATRLFFRIIALISVGKQYLQQKWQERLKDSKDNKENKEKKLQSPVIVSAVQKPIPQRVPVMATQPDKSFEKLEKTPEKKIQVEKNKLAHSPIPSSVKLRPGEVPPVTLLNPAPLSEGKGFSQISFEELSILVEQRLKDFGVEVKVVAVHPGPIITRFELDLAPGIKVSKITGLAKDIARSLMATSVRVVEVIPGKSVIGLELPNQHREMVVLRDILESRRYLDARSPVSLVLGKDIAGFPVVVDLAKMPHLLVAGTTGSGKSVSINAMLLSMLFKSTPEQLRFIMIDPKMLELSVYEGIPHLLTPVITDMKDAANALRWCVAEMDRRYRLMASLGVRNLAGYNAKVTEAARQKQPLAAPAWLVIDGKPVEFLEALPTIVVVADELADMMMVVGKKVEELIARIAQKARAAGIHLILATQRPSVDVITGLIKANIPTRVAFQVSSRIDSRTILDQQGAEQLLGNGDMLYLPPGTGVPVRVHGAFVADEEVHRVVAAWQTYGKPDYLAEVTEGSASEGAAGAEGGGEMDPLYDDALRIVTESRRASISLVQRRLKIGYNRAARIMEEMEAAGVVSTMDHSGSREVLAPPPVEV